MDAEVFEHHLTSPQGRGHVPAGAVTVTAEGGICGDTVVMSLATDGQRITDAGFSAEGCGATTAAASAAVSLVIGMTLLEAARIGASQINAELGGLSPGKFHAAEVAADALARALGFTAYRAGGIPAPGRQNRTLVAMSGGVDSAVVAALMAEQGDTVAVTLELWADRENDAERSCCSSSAVSLAPTTSASPTSPSICARSSAPGWWSRSSTPTGRGRPQIRVCAATATSASTP
jgi:tRNA-specific 2-thiouridylase